MGTKATEWRPGPTVCRCCLSEGCYKDISTEYFWMGKREVYEEMLTETFDLTVSFSKSGGPNSNSRLICEPCISRLRDATEFKRQVQECERTFMQYLDPGTSVENTDALEVEVEPNIKVETVKLEKRATDEEFENDDDDFTNEPMNDDDDYDDLDDEPLMKLASNKTPKEETNVLDILNSTKPEKRKATIKLKATSAKKTKKEAKPTSSKPKPEKKKKEVDSLYVARRNAKVVLKYSTVYPFRIPSNSMVCVYCCEQYDDPSDYRRHMHEDHATYNVDTAFAHTVNNYSEFLKVDCTDLACRICSERFDNIETIAKHLYSIHEKDIDPNIEVGMQMFKLGPERWVCALCSVKLPSLRELSRHTSCHYHKYTCETCGKSYINKENLQRHIRYGHSQIKICIKCKKGFPSLEARRVHILSSEKCWPQSCSYCGQRFVSRKLKLDHLSEVHGQTPKMYTCPECGLKFEKWHPYRAHFVLSHTSDNYTCGICGLKFEVKRSLYEHRLIHTKEKLFPCDICNKSFARKRNLIQHSWIHQEQKRFECTLCNRQFNQRVSWKTHMKSTHPDLVTF